MVRYQERLNTAREILFCVQAGDVFVKYGTGGDNDGHVNKYVFIESAGPHAPGGKFECKFRIVKLASFVPGDEAAADDDTRSGSGYITETFVATLTDPSLFVHDEYYKVPPGRGNLPVRGTIKGAMSVKCDGRAYAPS
jgi:hypothetical protein